MVKITDDESLEAWLDARPEDTRRADAVLIAARAALRVAPLLVRALGTDAANQRAAILLPTFRALAVAGYAGTWPQQATEIAAALDGARAASRDTAAIAVVHTARGAIRNAAYDAVRAARNAAVHAAVRRGVRCVRGANAADTNAAVSSDATALENGQDHAAIAAAPLWPQGTPDWATDHWARLKDHLSSEEARAEGWKVWIEWYQAHLDGDWIRPWSSALEHYILLIDDDVWNQGSGAVNEQIAKLIDDHAIGNH